MRLGTTLVVVVLLASGAAADGLLYRLPDDGSQARYELEVTFNLKGLVKSAKGIVTLSSVGVKDVEGKACRWIELKTVVDADGREEIDLIKMLIPEQHLRAGGMPLHHVIKGWHASRGQPPRPVKDFKGGGGGPAPFFLPGVLKDSRPLPRQVVDTKFGKMDCAGFTGTTAMDQGPGQMELTYENRVHDRIPFGVVSSRIGVKMLRAGKEEGTGTMVLRLTGVSHMVRGEMADKE